MNIFRGVASKLLLAPLSSGRHGGGGNDSPTPPDDSALVERSQKGDLQAFDALVTLHRDKVYSMVLKMVRNDADAWDISQDIFLKAWRALPKFEAKAKFSTWLFRIAHNAVYDFTRKRKNRQAAELEEGVLDYGDVDSSAPTTPSPSVRPDKALAREELRQQIHQAMARLSDNHRETIVLRELQGLDYKEIAEVMQCSIGTVMSRLYYARKKLQEDLKHD